MKNLSTVNLEALELETERLVLRVFKTKDSINNFVMLETENKILETIFKSIIDNSIYSWAIVLKKKNIIIGSIMIEDIKYSVECCTLNCYINPEFRNNNFATEALHKIIDFLVEIVGVKRVDLLCLYNNLAVQSLCKKCGMIKEAVLRNNVVISDKIDTLSVYAYFSDLQNYEDFSESDSLNFFMPDSKKDANIVLIKPKIIPDVVIESERLFLRSITLKDANDLFKHMFCKESSIKFLNLYAHKKINDTITFIKCTLDNYKNNPYERLWVIELKNSRDCIGFIGTKLENKSAKYYSIYYGIGEKFRNQGIATEALKQLINFLEKELKAKRIEAICACENLSSEKVIQKAGLSYEGTLHKFYKCKGEVQDVKVYSLINY